MVLEKGYGPANYGTTKVDLCDGLSEMSSFEHSFVKVERVSLAVFFTFLLVMAIYNIYTYLWKRRLYLCYPLVIGYVFLVLFSVTGAAYELYMGFACGNHDCFIHLLISITKEYRIYFFTEKHYSYITQISIFWKLR